jgi:hypothetical protein
VAVPLAGTGLVETQPAKFTVEPAAQPEMQHAEVGNEGPEGMSEGGRAIAFDKAVGKPGEAIADDRGR